MVLLVTYYCDLFSPILMAKNNGKRVAVVRGFPAPLQQTRSSHLRSAIFNDVVKAWQGTGNVVLYTLVARE